MIILRQKQYAAVSEKGAVIMKSKDALEEARQIRKNWDTSESSATIAKRILDVRKNAADESDNKWYNKPYIRKAIGFKKKYIQSHPDEQANWTRIGFHPDYTEPTGQTVKLGFKKFSTTTTHDKLYREWKKTRDPETAYRWSQAWGEEVYEKTREEDLGNLKPDPKAMKAADDFVKSQDPKNYAKMKRLNKDLEDAYKGGNPTTIENARNAINTWAKKNSRKQKIYSKQDREVVPDDIAKEGKKSGVIQKDKNGDWRIISYKTSPPTFWNSHYSSREKAEAALRGYQANK